MKPLQSMHCKVLKAVFRPVILICTHLRFIAYQCCLWARFIFYLFVMLYINHFRETMIRFLFLCALTQLSNILVEFICSTAQISKSTLISDPRLYNSLLSNIKGKKMYASFKYAVKQFFCRRPSKL